MCEQASSFPTPSGPADQVCGWCGWGLAHRARAEASRPVPGQPCPRKPAHLICPSYTASTRLFHGVPTPCTGSPCEMSRPPLPLGRRVPFDRGDNVVPRRHLHPDITSRAFIRVRRHPEQSSLGRPLLFNHNETANRQLRRGCIINRPSPGLCKAAASSARPTTSAKPPSSTHPLSFESPLSAGTDHRGHLHLLPLNPGRPGRTRHRSENSSG